MYNTALWAAFGTQFFVWLRLVVCNQALTHCYLCVGVAVKKFPKPVALLVMRGSLLEALGPIFFVALSPVAALELRQFAEVSYRLF